MCEVHKKLRGQGSTTGVGLSTTLRLYLISDIKAFNESLSLNCYQGIPVYWLPVVEQVLIIYLSKSSNTTV